MAAYPTLNLPKFSGSTLEPTVEPVAFMPASFYKSKRLSSSSSVTPTSPSLSFTSSSPDDDDDYSLPCSPLFPPTTTHTLNRPHRPTFIHIPASCKSYSIPDNHHDEGNWTSHRESDEFEWDEEAQTVYKRPDHHRNPHHSSRHIFWSL